MSNEHIQEMYTDLALQEAREQIDLLKAKLTEAERELYRIKERDQRAEMYLRGVALFMDGVPLDEMAQAAAKMCMHEAQLKEQAERERDEAKKHASDLASDLLRTQIVLAEKNAKVAEMQRAPRDGVT